MISAKRKRDTRKIIKRRLKQLSKPDYSNNMEIACNKHLKWFEQPNRLAKRDLGCNRSRCKCCHGEKFDDEIKETEPITQLTLFDE